MKRLADPEATRRRVRAWVCAHSSDIDPEEHTDAVLRLILRQGWEQLAWTKGWRKKRAA